MPGLTRSAGSGFRVRGPRSCTTRCPHTNNRHFTCFRRRALRRLLAPDSQIPPLTFSTYLLHTRTGLVGHTNGLLHAASLTHITPPLLQNPGSAVRACGAGRVFGTAWAVWIVFLFVWTFNVVYAFVPGAWSLLELTHLSVDHLLTTCLTVTDNRGCSIFAARVLIAQLTLFVPFSASHAAVADFALPERCTASRYSHESSSALRG